MSSPNASVSTTRSAAALGEGGMRRLTRQRIERLTDHEDVNRLLADLTDGVVGVLGSGLVGLYLTGSLTYGDFERGSSDIDFLAVLDRPLQDNERSSLVEMHARIAERYPIWAERIEGSYITKNMLDSIEPPSTPRPYINGGAFWEPDPQYGNEWMINLYALRERGVSLVGPDPADLIPEVSIEEVREASRRDLFEEWLPKLNDPAFFESSHLQAYVTLTLCRILHRAWNDEVVSKRVAASWVRNTCDEQWIVDLIDRAERWQHGQELASADQVRELIRFMLNELSPQPGHDERRQG